MGLDHRYLLIMACSQRKRPDPGLLPAIERYDGVVFRMLRKAKREGYWPANLDVLILSAKYGLLGPHALIEDYSLRMTWKQARVLQPQVSADLLMRFARVHYIEVFIDLGQSYYAAIEGLEPTNDMLVMHARGRIGERMKQLKSWLEAKSQRQDSQHE